MLVCDHRTHPNCQIVLNKRDPRRALCLRELLKHGLDHPARRAHRGRKHSHDGAVQAQQAAEKCWLRGLVDGRGWIGVEGPCRG